jgi:hypothetical protein
MDVLNRDPEVLCFQLAREIARNIIPVDEIKERLHLSEEDYQRLIKTPIFAIRLKEEVDTWSASTPKATSERIETKLGTMIEESIPEIYALIHDKHQPMSAKIAALQWATNIAGFGKRDNGPAALGERVKFNIYIGDQKVSFDKALEAPVIEGTSTLVKDVTGNP